MDLIQSIIAAAAVRPAAGRRPFDALRALQVETRAEPAEPAEPAGPAPARPPAGPPPETPRAGGTAETPRRRPRLDPGERRAMAAWREEELRARAGAAEEPERVCRPPDEKIYGQGYYDRVQLRRYRRARVLAGRLPRLPDRAEGLYALAAARPLTKKELFRLYYSLFDFVAGTIRVRDDEHRHHVLIEYDLPVWSPRERAYRLVPETLITRADVYRDFCRTVDDSETYSLFVLAKHHPGPRNLARAMVSNAENNICLHRIASAILTGLPVMIFILQILLAAMVAYYQFAAPLGAAAEAVLAHVAPPPPPPTPRRPTPRPSRPGRRAPSAPGPGASPNASSRARSRSSTRSASSTRRSPTT